MCTWNGSFTCVFQPIAIAVGRISLGRIYNVIGSIIDRYLALNLSSQFNLYTLIVSDVYFIINRNLSYSLSITLLQVQIFQRVNGLLVNIGFIIMSARFILIHWVFYIAYLS